MTADEPRSGAPDDRQHGADKDGPQAPGPEFDPILFTDPGVSEEAAMTFSEDSAKVAHEIERLWAQLTPDQKDEVRRRLLKEGLIDTVDDPG